MVSSATGNAGEYLVMAELLFREFDAYLAGRENPAFDIACFANPSRRGTRLRVKTTTDGKAKYSAKSDGSHFRTLGDEDDFVVIVNASPKLPRREFYVIPTKVVEEHLRSDFEFYVSHPGRNAKSKMRCLTLYGEERETDRGYGYDKKFNEYRDAWGLLT